MISLPILPLKAKLIGLAIVGVGIFYAGWSLHGTFYKAKENSIKDATIKQLVVQDDKNRKVITSLQKNEATLQETYVWLGKELGNAKGKLAKCKSDGSVILSPSAVRLWDSIGEGTMPKDSTRVTSGTSSGSSPEPEITLDDLYENRRINAKNCNKMRQQIRAIIEWDKETFKK